MAPFRDQYPGYAGFLKGGLEAWQWPGSSFVVLLAAVLTAVDTAFHVDLAMGASAIKQLIVSHLHKSPILFFIVEAIISY